jgi:hypothetical protein
MHRALAWSLVVVLLCAFSAPAQPRFTTRVVGTVPDLVGRWLVVTQVRSGRSEGGGNGAAQLWDVEAPDGTPQLTVRDVRLPPALQADLDAANQARRDWEPSAGQLAELRDAWATLPAYDRGVAEIETVITGKDAFGAVIKSDARMRESDFVIQIVAAFTPGPNRPIKDVLLFGATGPTPFGYSGNFASASIAAGAVPIPIALQGVFRLYRLESAPAPGVLARIADVFAGCGRGRSSRADR